MYAVAGGGASVYNAPAQPTTSNGVAFGPSDNLIARWLRSPDKSYAYRVWAPSVTGENGGGTGRNLASGGAGVAFGFRDYPDSEVMQRWLRSPYVGSKSNWVTPAADGYQSLQAANNSARVAFGFVWQTK